MSFNVEGYEIELGNLDKPLFPNNGITKGDVVEYYHSRSKDMLVHLRWRPLTLHRFPDGIGKGGFYQQHAADYFPAWVVTRRLPHAESGDREKSIRHVLCNNAATLIYLANQAVITLHRWMAHMPRYTRADCIVFDLDPSGDDFTQVRDAARYVIDLMQQMQLTPYVMTTGSRGLHVLAPLLPELHFDRIRAVARRMADHLAACHADILTTEQRKDKRRGRLYLDIMRNAYGQTAVAPYSLRAISGAPVATPLALGELEYHDLGPRDYHINNIGRRLNRSGDPWANMSSRASDPSPLEKRSHELKSLN